MRIEARVCVPMEILFGLGELNMKRPTQISEKACLQYYLPFSVRQFMRSKFILVAYHFYNQIMTCKSGLITGRGGFQDDTSFAKPVLTLTEEEIQSAANYQDKNRNNPDASCYTSTSGLFFENV